MSREERGQIAGDLIIDEKYTLWGAIAGNVTVVNGGKFYNRGAIYGNLHVQPGGRVHIFGSVQGDVVLGEKTKVIHSGIIDGDLVNEGGRLYVDAISRVNGKFRDRGGETTFENSSAPDT